MYEGKPMVLVIGASDTGRTPIAAALLRKALGAGVIVRTAGVVSHEGESAMPEAQMALEQMGIDLSRHIARQLKRDEHAQAELLLAVDRGTEMVLFTEFPRAPRVACLPVLADLPDVLDPHRMPLGVWIAAARQLQEQVEAALSAIRTRLNIADQAPLPPHPPAVERRTLSGPQPLLLGTGHKMKWDRDADMQRLLSLINGEAAPDATLNGQTEMTAAPPTRVAYDSDESAPVDAARDDAAITAVNADLAASADATLELSRAEHVARIVRMLAVAEELPEIIDWLGLRAEIVRHLRAVAEQAEGPLDFAPAAILMIEGKLTHQRVLPDTAALGMLRDAIERLATPLSAAGLATIGGELGQW